VNKRKALASKHAPRRLGLSLYAVVWLLLDRWQPPGWVWGVVGTVCAVVFIASLIDFFTAEDVELT
jgi:hypothetical protein